MIKKTIAYYNINADSFVDQTIGVDIKDTQERFIQCLKGNNILDFGCGSGRDTKYFLDKGYDVTAIDGSEELCKKASEYTGIDVKHMYFQELQEVETYDGIWACSSILHLNRNELKDVFIRMRDALVADGIIYTSFKYGDFEGERNERYFIDFTLDAFKTFLSDIIGLTIIDDWITSDVRPGRGEEKWLNLILKKD